MGPHLKALEILWTPETGQCARVKASTVEVGDFYDTETAKIFTETEGKNCVGSA